jgi:hypothetical protein
MLVILALAACTLAVTKMAAWWVIVPPFVMLTGYLGLLREAAKADAERRELARARAAEAAARRPARPVEPSAATPAATPVAPPAAPPAAAPGTAPAAGTAVPAAAAPAAPGTRGAPRVPAAEIIDISASLGAGGEEIYDQYADAKLRAVGDLRIPRPRTLIPRPRTAPLCRPESGSVSPITSASPATGTRR